jgi:hypothetical protein
MPPGAWYVIGREDLRPRVRALEPTDSAETNSPAQTGLAPIPTVATGRADGVRLDLRVIPVRPATPPVPPPPVEPPTPPTIEPTATGLRILRDESYRRRFLDRLRERFDPDVPPVRAPAGS